MAHGEGRILRGHPTALFEDMQMAHVFATREIGNRKGPRLAKGTHRGYQGTLFEDMQTAHVFATRRSALLAGFFFKIGNLQSEIRNRRSPRLAENTHRGYRATLFEDMQTAHVFATPEILYSRAKHSEVTQVQTSV